MWLTGAGVVTAVEEREKSIFVSALAAIIVSFDTCPRGVEVGRLQHMCLLLELGGGEDEVFWNNCELVQDEVVSWTEVRDLEGSGGVGERVERLLVGVFGRTLWLVGECWREAKLKLARRSALVHIRLYRLRCWV